MVKKKGSPMLWFFISVTLGGLAVHLYDEYSSAEAPAPSASASHSAAPAAPPVILPYEWPIVRWLDQASGEWTSDDGTKFNLTAKRVKKSRDWLMVFTNLPKSGATDSMTCEVSPELKDGGFSATCNGYGQEQDASVFFRLHMNLDKKLHIECPLFGITFKAKAAP